MSTFRVQKNKKHPYTIIDNTSINDKRLSAKAKGILLYLISKPDNWYTNLNNLISAFSDGRQSIRSGIKELIKFGYIVRTQVRKENGQFDYFDYLVFEKPIKPTIDIIISSPKSENRTSVKRTSDNRTLLNTDKKESTDKKETTTTSVVLLDNVVVDSSHSNIDKEKLITKLNNLNIKDHEKLFELFTFGDILKYSTWIEQCNPSMKNPTGYLITAIKEKWIEEIYDPPEEDHEYIYWYNCNTCKCEIGFKHPMELFEICNKCTEKLRIKKMEDRYHGTD